MKASLKLKTTSLKENYSLKRYLGKYLDNPNDWKERDSQEMSQDKAS